MMLQLRASFGVVRRTGSRHRLAMLRLLRQLSWLMIRLNARLGFSRSWHADIGAWCLPEGRRWRVDVAGVVVGAAAASAKGLFCAGAGLSLIHLFGLVANIVWGRADG